MKKAKKIVAFAIVFAMVLGCFSQISSVLAQTFGGGENLLRLDIVNNDEFDISSVQVDGYSWTEANKNDDYGDNSSVHNIVIVVPEKDGKIPTIRYGENWRSLIQTTTHVEDHVWTFELRVLNTVPENGNFLGLTLEKQGDPVEPGPDEPRFDGHAYVLWSCDGGVCYHEFFDIPDFDDGNSTFYKDTLVRDDNDDHKYFDVHAEYKAWALPEKFELWVEAYKAQNNVEEIDWTHVDPEDIIAEFPPDMREWEEAATSGEEPACTRPMDGAPGNDWDAFEACVDNYYIEAGNLPFIRLKPVGEPSAKNAYVSYGDRNFKVVIYNDDYRGLTLGDLRDLEYYPAHWTNAFLKVDQYDISGTTKNRPALMDSILLEDEVHFKVLEYNDYSIVSVEALDVPEDAVDIREEDGEYILVFSSNFYDHVVFKITDDSEREYYVRIDRYTVDAYLNYVWNDELEPEPENQHPAITAEFYFERDKHYDDFNLTAKIIYKDGTIKNVALEPIQYIDDGLGNITRDAYEVDQEIGGFDEWGGPLPTGKGLMKSVFRYDLEKGEEEEIERVYVNAEYAEDLGEGTYAGAYTGSGEGVKVKMGEEE